MASEQLIPPLVMLVALAIGFSLAPRALTKTPRENRRLQRRTALFLVPVFGINLYFAIQRGSAFLVAVWVFVIGVWAWKVFHGETIAGERESRINFALNPGRCGRCDYDLTANATGVSTRSVRPSRLATLPGIRLVWPMKSATKLVAGL